MLTRGLVGSVLVLLGGIVTSNLPPSTPVLASATLRAVRDSAGGRAVAVVVVLVGLALLAHAWLGLCRRVVEQEPTDKTSQLTRDRIALVRRATVLWTAPLVLAPPLFSRDGWSYAAQGMLVHLGLSPYDHGPGVLAGPIAEAVDPKWLQTPAPYGPVPLGFGGLVAAHTGSPWLLVIAHRGLALVGLALLAWSIPRLAAWTGVDPALASALGLASPLMVADGVGGLHNDLLMAGLVGAALVSAARSGWVVGAVVGGLAAGVKAPGGLVWVGVVLVTLGVAATPAMRLRRTAQVAAVGLATLLVLGVVSGLGVGWIGATVSSGDQVTSLSLTTSVGGDLDRAARAVGLGLPPATFLHLVRGLAVVGWLGLSALLLLRGPTGSRAGALQVTAVVVAGALVASPVVHLWYTLWLTPVAVTLRLPVAAMRALVVALVVAGLASPFDTSLHAVFGGVVLVPLVVPRARAWLDRIVGSPDPLVVR